MSWAGMPDGIGVSEWTTWTERAHGTMKRLCAQRPDLGFERKVLGAEMRIRVGTPEGAYVVSVMGQATSHGKTGTHPARLTLLRELAEPVFFMTVQGDSGFGAWLVDGVEPECVPIDFATGHKRWGYLCSDMIALAFSTMAVERPATYQRTMWRWPEAAPEPTGTGRLI